MTNFLWFRTSACRKLLLAGFSAVALSAAAPAWRAAYAQGQPRALPTREVVKLHVRGLELQHRGDNQGAFVAFLDAAEQGYPPAQRRLGEIYDSGNSAVKRDYEESIRWYQKAREGGEVLPPQPSYGTMSIPRVNIGR